MGTKRVGENRRDELFCIVVLQMDEVSGAVEREAVLRKRSAQSSYSGLLFKQNRVAVGQMVSRAHTGEPAADDDDPFLTHERMSTFISRYADRNAVEIVPPIVAKAHSSVTWLIRRATPLRSAPMM